MTAPSIVYGTMPTTAKNSEAVGWFRITGQVDRLEFSLDGGTTWTTTAALAGGTLVGAVGVIAGQGSVTITPTTLGTHPFKVRAVSITNGAGAPFDASLVVISTSAMGIARIYDQRIMVEGVVPSGTGFIGTGYVRKLVGDASGTRTVSLDNATISITDGGSKIRPVHSWIAKWDDEANVAWVANVRFNSTTANEQNHGILGSVTDSTGDLYIAYYIQAGQQYTVLNADGSTFLTDTALTTAKRIRLLKINGATGACIWTSYVDVQTTNNPGQSYVSGTTSTAASLVARTDERLALAGDSLYLTADWVTSANSSNGVTVTSPAGGTTSGILLSLSSTNGTTNWGRLFRSSATSIAISVLGVVARPSNTQIAVQCRFSNPGSIKMYATAADPGTSLGTSGSGDSGVVLVMNADATGVIARQNMPISGRGLRQDATGQNLYALSVASSGNYTFGGGTTYTPSGQTVYLAKFNASSLALVSVTQLGAVASGGSVSGLGLTTDKDFGPMIFGAFQVGFGSLTSQGGLDGMLLRLSPTDLSETFALTAFRPSAAISDITQWTSAHPSGGGVSILRVAGGAVASAVNFSKGTASIAVPGTTGDHFALFTFDDDGTPEQLPGGPFEPPPGSETILDLTWPGTSNEDDLITGSASLYNPEASTGYDSIAWEVWDPGTQQWYVGSRAFASDTYGRGTFSLTDSGSGNADLEFEPQDDWHGTVETLIRARGTLGGSELPAAPIKLRTVIAPVYDVPEAPEGEMPEVDEDNPSVGTFVAPNPDGGPLTWELDSATEAPYGAGSTGTVNVFDEDAAVVGTVAVTSGQGGTGTAQITFTPVANWHGTAEFSLRVSDGTTTIDWQTVAVTVRPVADAPSPITPTVVPAFNEDGFIEQTFAWTDPDEESAFSVELALATVTVEGEGDWQTVEVADTFDLGTVLVRVTDIDPEAREATLRFEPIANWWGSYSFAARVADADGDLYSEPVTITGTVLSVPDTPGRVTPSTMPRVLPGAIKSQTFSTVDPDSGESWVFTVAPSATGPWTSSLTIAGKGDVEVVDSTSADQQATVAFTADPSGFGRYRFYIRATDSTGLSSIPTLVTGYISGAAVNAYLQRITRTTSAATIERICPLTTISSLSVTEALDGPGGASITVTAGEIAARAAAAGVTVSELLDPAAVELAIYIGLEPYAVGPLTGFDYDAAGDGAVSIYSAGLLSVMEGRLVNAEFPLGSTSYLNQDQSFIAWQLISTTQSEDYGALALTDGTTPTGTNTTIEFANSITIAEALTQLAQIADAAEVWVDPDRTFRAAAVRGSDKRSSIRLSGAMLTSVNRGASSDAIVTTAIVIGADKPAGGKYMGTYTDATAAARHGALVRVVDAPNLTSDASCVALGREVVLRHSAAPESAAVSVVIDPQRPFGVGDLRAGDVIALDLDDPVLGRVQLDARIINITTDLVSDTYDAFVVNLDIEPAVWVDDVLQGSRSRHVAELYATASEALYG